LKINSHISNSWSKKLIALTALLAITAVVSYATLGDGKVKKTRPVKSLLSVKTSRPGSFSLQSGYRFRGTQVINLQEQKYINLNTVVTYQQGHTTYVVPVKKKVSVNLVTQENNVRGATFKIKF
jgi:hypothetical protein